MTGREWSGIREVKPNGAASCLLAWNVTRLFLHDSQSLPSRFLLSPRYSSSCSDIPNLLLPVKVFYYSLSKPLNIFLAIVTIGKPKRSAVQANSDIRSFFSKKPASTTGTGPAGVGSKKRKLSEPVLAEVPWRDLDSDAEELELTDKLVDDLLPHEKFPDPSSPDLSRVLM
ncbi:hypothetical protein DL546_005022 [Coniochaeta pulveracea]|uniref:Uncharacterized protein n=1 Tax=Coniochaeta pulveracea TaxID=177199 RepID=A0A420YDL4_9PEZI|nr:hypothetical protein DL546_005022 [Coniochaeta pulveracea]